MNSFNFHGKVESNIHRTKEIFVPKILHGEFLYNDFIQKQRNYINSLPLIDDLDYLNSQLGTELEELVCENKTNEKVYYQKFLEFKKKLILRNN